MNTPEKMERMRAARAAKGPVVHLFRGAPAVRSWSTHQETIEGWTLCGIDRQLSAGPQRHRAECVEDPSLVSCPYCVELMHPTACVLAKTGCSFCESKAMRPSRKSALAGEGNP
jgi:hypothetical protein